MWVAGVTKSCQSNILLMYLAQNDLLATAKIALDQDSRHSKKKLLRQHLHNFQFSQLSQEWKKVIRPALYAATA
jgi:hypothetical protein